MAPPRPIPVTVSPPRLPVYLKEPMEVLAWASDHFGDQLVFQTTLEPESVVIIDMIHKIRRHIPVYVVATPPHLSTRQCLQQRILSRYGIPQSAGIDSANANGNANGLPRPPRPRAGAASISSLRREQSPRYATMETFEWSASQSRVLVNPLSWWTQEQVETWIRHFDVPYLPSPIPAAP